MILQMNWEYRWCLVTVTVSVMPLLGTGAISEICQLCGLSVCGQRQSHGSGCFGNDHPVAPPPVVEDTFVLNDKVFMRQVAGAFLKVFEDIKLRDDAALLLSAQNPPDVVIIDEDEFKKRVMEHEVNRQKV